MEERASICGGVLGPRLHLFPLFCQRAEPGGGADLSVNPGPEPSLSFGRRDKGGRGMSEGSHIWLGLGGRGLGQGGVEIGKGAGALTSNQ